LQIGHTAIYLRPFSYIIQLLAMALRSNLESIFNTAVNILSPECCYFPIGKGAKYCMREKAFSAIATSASTSRFLYPYGAVNFLCAIGNKVPNCK
jgi:hypothetical protein